MRDGSGAYLSRPIPACRNSGSTGAVSPCPSRQIASAARRVGERCRAVTHGPSHAVLSLAQRLHSTARGRPRGAPDSPSEIVGRRQRYRPRQPSQARRRRPLAFLASSAAAPRRRPEPP
jgi:hypothetical protein